VLLCQGAHVPSLRGWTALGGIKYTQKRAIQGYEEHLLRPDVQSSDYLLDWRTGTPFSYVRHSPFPDVPASVGWGESWRRVMPARNRGRGFVLFGKHLKGLGALANLHCSCVFRQQNGRGRTERGKRAELRIRTGSLSRAQASLAESVVANGAGGSRIQASAWLGS